MGILQPGDIIYDANGKRYIVESYTGDGYMAKREGSINESSLFFPEDLV